MAKNSERVCPKCLYPDIAQDRQGWFCLNGGCGRFDKPVSVETEWQETESNETKWQEFSSWWNSLTEEERQQSILKSIDDFVEGERHGSDAEVFGTRSIDE